MPGLHVRTWKMGISRSGGRKAERDILSGIALFKLNFVGDSTVRAGSLMEANY